MDGGFRGGEDALCGTGGLLRGGEPCSLERLARSAEREPREPGSLTTEVPIEVHPGGRMGPRPRFFSSWVTLIARSGGKESRVPREPTAETFWRGRSPQGDRRVCPAERSPDPDHRCPEIIESWPLPKPPRSPATWDLTASTGVSVPAGWARSSWPMTTGSTAASPSNA